MIGIVLLATGACGPTTLPVAPAPPPSAVRRDPPLAPPPLESVATRVPVERAERWSPPARLIDQRHIDSGRTIPGRSQDDFLLDVSFNVTGTLAAMLSRRAVSVWRRKPGDAVWKQVLREPWAIHWLGWRGDELRLCGSDGIAALFAGERLEWRRIERSACLRAGPGDSPRSDLDGVSSDGRWTASVTPREVCSGRMNRVCWPVGLDSALRGPSRAALAVTGGAALPALAPSGRLVDGSDAELGAWAFRPAGRLDAVVDATALRSPGLWRDFLEGKPLAAPAALRDPP